MKILKKKKKKDAKKKKKEPQEKSKWLFYPDDYRIDIWNMFMMVILILACIITPLRLAMVRPEEKET